MKKRIFSTLISAAGSALVAGIAVNNIKSKEIDSQSTRADKNSSIIVSLARWISIMQEGKSLTEYFNKYQYKTVAIYGMHYIGERLFQELTRAGIEVKYAIDQNRNLTEVNVELKKPTDYLEEVDAVIVTPVYYFQSINAQLSKVLACPIISFDEILDEVEVGYGD